MAIKEPESEKQLPAPDTANEEHPDNARGFGIQDKGPQDYTMG